MELGDINKDILITQNEGFYFLRFNCMSFTVGVYRAFVASFYSIVRTDYKYIRFLYKIFY